MLDESKHQINLKEQEYYLALKSFEESKTRGASASDTSNAKTGPNNSPH